MSEPYLGQIKPVAFAFAPKGWALCNGQLLPTNQNQALFSLLGTTYGGDGITTFALPNLQGRVPIHVGSGYPLGQSGGEETHALTVSELPTHAHPVTASSNTAAQVSPANGFAAANGSNRFGPIPTGTLAGTAVGSAGGSPTPFEAV